MVEPTMHFLNYPPTGIDPSGIQFKRLRRDQYPILFRDFKRRMLASHQKKDDRTFQTGGEAEISDRPVACQFLWKSDTAGIMLWAYTDESEKAPRLQAVTAFLTRLDRGVEEQMLEKIKANPDMAGIQPAAFADARDFAGPAAATFYVNETALGDSLIRAMLQAASAAFFDQFGMFDPGNVIELKFKGLVFIPKNAGAPRPALREHRLPDSDEQNLFRLFTENIKGGRGFETALTIVGDERPISIRFAQMTHTAAFAMLSYDVGGEPQHIHGLVVILPKLDRAEDKRVVDQCREYAALGQLDPSCFDVAMQEPQPVVATFFADTGSAEYPPLMTLIRILGAAYFGQFGIGQDAQAE